MAVQAKFFGKRVDLIKQDVFITKGFRLLFRLFEKRKALPRLFLFSGTMKSCIIGLRLGQCAAIALLGYGNHQAWITSYFQSVSPISTRPLPLASSR